MTERSATPAAASQADNGAALRGLLESGTRWLERNAAAVDALNVFPVPDGDTGKNMLLTMRAALDQAAKAPSSGAGDVMRAAAQGAVMGARGNSGVILSQILAGMARGLEGRQVYDGPLLARALVEGANTAYRAVTRPVEGTILTVARAAGEAALRAVGSGGQAGAPSAEQVLDRALAAAQEAVARTPEQLAILRQAGVVDAGGEGYRVILEGMALAQRGQPLPDAPAEQSAGASTAAVRAAKADLSALPADEWGYCTQFVIQGERLDLTRIRDELQELAASALVVGDESLVRVHGHTEDPGRLLSYAVQKGRMQRISIEDMDAQHDQWLRLQVQSTGGGGETRGTSGFEGGPGARAAVATVAVVPGAGFGELFGNFGAAIVSGGQTMNPSAQDILDAARAAGAGSALVLPNNGNVIMAAKQAAGLAEAEGLRLLVVPSRTVPQGIAAQLAFDPAASAESNLKVMTEALGHVRTVEVTRATRSVTLGQVEVRAGDVLALVDDEVVAAGSDPLEIAARALDRAGSASAEVITLYGGEGVDDAAAEAMRSALHARYPRAEVEVLPGGQPHYDFIISVE